MWSWETIVLVVLALLAFGAQLGDVQVNRYVVAVWCIAALVVVVRWFHREPSQGRPTDNSTPQKPERERTASGRPTTRPDYVFTEAKLSRGTPSSITTRELATLAKRAPNWRAKEAVQPHLHTWVTARCVVINVTDDPNTDVVGVSIAEDETNIQIQAWLNIELQSFVRALELHKDRVEIRGRMIEIYQNLTVVAPAKVTLLATQQGM